MDKQTVVDYFGSQSKVAAALTTDGRSLTRQSVHKWKDELIPELHAIRLDEITNGALKYDKNLYKDRG